MDVTLKLSDELSSKSQQEQSEALDREIDRFSQWLAALPDSKASGALSRSERALIKTYLVQKLTGKLDRSS